MKKVEMKIKTKIALSMVAGGLAGTALTGFGLYELVKRSPDLMPDLAIQIGIAAWGVFLLIAGVLHFCVEGAQKRPAYGGRPQNHGRGVKHAHCL